MAVPQVLRLSSTILQRITTANIFKYSRIAESTKQPCGAIFCILIVKDRMFNRESVEKVRKPLLERGQTIAEAESVTAGLLQAALASAEEASKIFQGGITVYNIGQKSRHLDIDPIHAADCNCVSSKMATDMATSVAKLFTAHWGIGITGYATPVPESGDAIFAHISITLNGEEKLARRIDGGDRIALDAQLHFVEEVLRGLEEALRG